MLEKIAFNMDQLVGKIIAVSACQALGCIFENVRHKDARH